MVNWIKELITNTFKTSSKIKSWKDVEYFDTIWKVRIETMSQFIYPTAVVMDLGCGKMWLREYLHYTNIYIPVDYLKRDQNTMVCDFNNYEFPTQVVDISFISGCLEYINDHSWFVKNVCLQSNRCIISYCILEKFPNITNRKKAHWVNNLSEKDLINLFSKNEYTLSHQIISQTENNIYCFDRIN